MRRNVLFYCLFLSAAAMVTGCTLDSPREFGDPCDNPSFIWIAGETIRMEDNALDYAVNFRQGLCPVNAQYCMTMKGELIGDDFIPDSHFCSDKHEACPVNSHWFEGDCERDTASHCGSHENNCLDRETGVAAAECVNDTHGNKSCVAKKCLDTYALLEDTCKSGAECCGDYCEDCSRIPPQTKCFTENINASSMTCGEHCPAYAPKECNGVCIDPNTNLTFCGSENCELHYCADAIEGWRNGRCIEGQCRVSDCTFGYHLEKNPDGSKRCVPDTPSVCGELKLNCLDEIEHANLVDCMAGSCIVKKCDNGYYTYDNQCIEAKVVQCGNDFCAPNQQCNDKTQTCECIPGYTDCGGVCYDLKSNAYHCGSCETQCRFANAESECRESECRLAKCHDGYAYSNQTESCVFTGKCEKGYEFSDETNKCEPKVCGADYHLNGNTCEPDDINNCGAPGADCKVEHAENRCEDGECIFICENGYTESSDGLSCEAVNCTDGERSCSDHENIGYIIECIGHNWGETSACPSDYSCLDAETCGNCTNDKKQCSDGTHYQICQSGNWDEAQSCIAPEHGIAKCTGEGDCSFDCEAGYCVSGLECVSSQTDMANCGSCNAVCSTESVTNATEVECISGSCVATNCIGGYRPESGGCIPNDCSDGEKTCTNESNIGQVRTCSGGVYGTASACSNVSCNSSNNDCGSCKNNSKQCSGTTPQICTNGSWTNQTACTAPTHGTAKCTGNGECSYTCNSGYTDNGKLCCANVDNGSIIKDNSTTCSFTCASGYTSNGTECIKYDSYCDTNGTSRCVNSGTTGKIEKCINNIWTEQNTCSSNYSCNSAGTACGSCINDAKQCSGRIPQTCSGGKWTGNSECSSDKICSGAGNCTSCSTNQHVYQNTCENNSTTNCGSNGHACDVEHATNSCSTSGVCSFTCDSNYHKNSAGTGCEVNSITDCGASHAKCDVEHATNSCSTSGVCSFTCDSNYHKNSAGTGCEVNSITDCGASHAQCNVANATNTCSTSGVCGFTCSSNYHKTSDGKACEVNSITDCGASHAKCNVANATNTCSTSGVCSFTCDSNYHKNAAGTGCEINSITDCGASHAQCNVANATNRCSTSGVCSFTCNLNYHTNLAETACEPDTDSDCGELHQNCTNVTHGTAYCDGGACTIECDTYWHPYNGSCEADSNTNCGSHGATCSSGRYCCDDGERVRCGTKTVDPYDPFKSITPRALKLPTCGDNI